MNVAPPITVEEAVTTSKLPEVARGNIDTVTQISQEFSSKRSRSDRLGEAVIRGVATARVVLAHLFGVGAWIAVNAGMIPGLPVFDPFPFSLLGLLVSLEAVFLAMFVLMNQKWQTQQNDHWAHLNLQIGLLSEQEATKMLQLLTAISDRLGVQTSHDSELKEMAKKTVINHLAQELADNLEKSQETSPPDHASQPPP